MANLPFLGEYVIVICYLLFITIHKLVLGPKPVCPDGHIFFFWGGGEEDFIVSKQKKIVKKYKRLLYNIHNYLPKK